MPCFFTLYLYTILGGFLYMTACIYLLCDPCWQNELSKMEKEWTLSFLSGPLSSNTIGS